MKKFLSIMVICLFMISTIVSANEYEFKDYENSFSYSTDSVREINSEEALRIDVSDRYHLTNYNWTSLDSRNNIFNMGVYVTNDSLNSGGVWIRVTDRHGAIIAGDVYVNRGEDKYITQVPWNSGEVKILAMAAENSGVYYLRVHD
ncbi:hypothetical protein [Peptoniphilus asaccharolyticus]